MNFKQEMLENEKIVKYMDNNRNTTNEELINQTLGRKLTQEELKAVEWKAAQNMVKHLEDFGRVSFDYENNAVRNLIVGGNIPNILREFYKRRDLNIIK